MSDDQYNLTQRHRILVIDDSPNIHEDFRKILCADRRSSSVLEEAETLLFGKTESVDRHQREFDIDSAFQGEQGLARVYHALQEGRPYEMAFVDVRMPPGLDGIEVTPKLWVADPELQIVICTAYSDYSWEEMFARIGTSGRMFLLKKPFDRIEVLQLAHNLTRKWQTSHLSKKDQKRRQVQESNPSSTSLTNKLNVEITQLRDRTDSK